MVSFARKGLIALSVTILASAFVGVAATYASSGGGCNTSADNVLGACVSENGSHNIVADAYVSGSHSNCTLVVTLYDNGNFAGNRGYNFSGSGHFGGPVVGATAGHYYYTVAILSCDDVADTEGSPTQYA